MYASFDYCVKKFKTNKLNFVFFYIIIVNHFMQEMN